jgi:hypothetical protein
VTVPPAVAVWNWRVAESVTVVPTTGVVEDRVVLIVTPVTTLRGSHAEVAALLLASPLYTALKLKPPVALKRTAREFGTIPLVTVTVETALPGAVHAPFVNRL